MNDHEIAKILYWVMLAQPDSGEACGWMLDPDYRTDARPDVFTYVSGQTTHYYSVKLISGKDKRWKITEAGIAWLKDYEERLNG